ncbi:MAG: hypothetical protein Q8Q35_02110 [Nanoarchaeota archaeon]|nr:hypothetical protein [Nanoarchaeota archaeon]
MNKRGQIYILAAIVLSIAIFSVVKITNSFVAPPEDNFDFFVENFEGERSYVMNLGYLQDREGSYYLKGTESEEGLLEVFQDFGLNVGVVLVEYNGGWTVTNYLGEIVTTECDGCDSFSIPSAAEGAADVSFSLEQGGKKFRAGEGTNLGNLDSENKYFSYNIEDKETITLNINNNDYVFERPSGGQTKVESLLFRNIGKNYVKVVKV